MSKRRGWTPFNIFRTAFCLSCGVGLSLTGLLVLNPDFVERFMGSAWMLPSITLVYFLCLVLTHLPHPTKFGLGRYGANKQYLNLEKQNPEMMHDGGHREGIAAEAVPLSFVPSETDTRPGHHRNISGFSAYEDFRSPGLMAPSPMQSTDNTPQNSSFPNLHSAESQVPISPYDPTRDSDQPHHDGVQPSAAAAHRASMMSLYPTDLYEDHEHRELNNRMSTHGEHGIAASPPSAAQAQGPDATPPYDVHERRKSSMPLLPDHQAPPS